jgi:hypothetical protein
MNHLRRIFAAAVTLAGAVLALAAAPAAFAMQVPPPGQGSGIAPPPPPVRVIAEGGMPGWQITLKTRQRSRGVGRARPARNASQAIRSGGHCHGHGGAEPAPGRRLRSPALEGVGAGRLRAQRQRVGLRLVPGQ